MADVVIVGAGPNGLAAAVRLAAAGRQVVVLEAAATVGGGTRSAELTLPGFVHDICAAVHALAAHSPVFSPEVLGDAAHTLRWIVPEIPLAHPLDNGRAAVLHRDLAATVAALGDDGPRWRRLLTPLLDEWPAMSGQLLRSVVSVPTKPLLMASFAARAAIPVTVMAKYLGGGDAAALFAGNAAHAFVPLNRPLTSAVGLLLAASAHDGGWPFAASGSQAVADALAARLVELGGEIRTGVTVRSMADMPKHRTALFDTNPAQVAAIAGEALPHRYRARLTRFRHGPGAFKIDYALDGPVPWTDESCRRAGTVHVIGGIDELVAAEASIASGKMPDRPFVLVAQQSLFDPGRAPLGKHTLWAYAHVPAGFDGDATAAIEAQIERFAPGFGDLILARHVTNTSDFARYNLNYVGGDIGGGALSGMQMIFRPTVSLRPYATPNPSILICSASTPPGAGVHGMCGWHAAGRVLDGARRAR